jgi:hypothetical protein
LARDRQDRPALEKLSAEAAAAEQKADGDAAAHYRAALAWSYLAEVAQELRDKGGVKRAAEAGIRAAERAVALKPDVAEYHRLLGTLYGQIVPVNLLTGFSYGKKSQDAISKAIELDPKSSAAYVSRHRQLLCAVGTRRRIGSGHPGFSKSHRAESEIG